MDSLQDRSNRFSVFVFFDDKEEIEKSINNLLLGQLKEIFDFKYALFKENNSRISTMVRALVVTSYHGYNALSFSCGL